MRSTLVDRGVWTLDFGFWTWILDWTWAWQLLRLKYFILVTMYFIYNRHRVSLSLADIYVVCITVENLYSINQLTLLCLNLVTDFITEVVNKGKISETHKGWDTDFIGNPTITRVVFFPNHINQWVGRVVPLFRSFHSLHSWWLIRTTWPTSWLCDSKKIYRVCSGIFC